MKLPSIGIPKLPDWALDLIVTAVVVLLGFAWGYHVRGNAINAATVKQVVKVAQVEAKDTAAVEGQNHDDADKITQLTQDLAAARAAAAARGVPAHPGRCLPAAQADAGPGAPASTPDESARRYDEAYRAFREELIAAGAVTEQLRLQVLSCQAQWPK